jgi:hypothetical protein
MPQKPAEKLTPEDYVPLFWFPIGSVFSNQSNRIGNPRNIHSVQKVPWPSADIPRTTAFPQIEVPSQNRDRAGILLEVQHTILRVISFFNDKTAGKESTKRVKLISRNSYHLWFCLPHTNHNLTRSDRRFDTKHDWIGGHYAHLSSIGCKKSPDPPGLFHWILNHFLKWCL